MPHTLPPLIPPFRHCLIEDGIYRGAQPSLKNMRFMRRLKLRTILSLIPEATGPSRDLREYCATEHIHLIWHQVDKYDDGFSHTPQLVASILSQLVDPRNHPLFLHCRDGTHNTGLVVMCLRRLQNWSLPAIYDEFVRYTKSNAITFEEKQFVESFHATVSIPIHIPSWLWEGVRHRKHPSIQLDLETDPDPLTTSNLRSPPRPQESADMERLAQLVSPRGESPRVSTVATTLTRHAVDHIRVQMHYAPNLAALDLTGVHFVSCCRRQRYAEVTKGIP